MKKIDTGLKGAFIFECDIQYDNRGMEIPLYSKKEYDILGINTEFVETTIYQIESKNTFYGIHYQNNPKPQSKIIKCLKGCGMDYVVDLRKDSLTYKRWVSIYLSAKNNKQIFIPPGFGHAFLSIMNDTHLFFSIDEYFDPHYSGAISYKDPEIKLPIRCNSFIQSEYDKSAPFLKDSNCSF